MFYCFCPYLLVFHFFFFFFFFFNDTATTEIYTLSLHDALPIRGVPKPGDVELERDIVRQGEPASGGVLKHLVAEPAQQTYDHHSACHLDRRLTAPAPGPSA